MLKSILHRGFSLVFEKSHFLEGFSNPRKDTVMVY